MYQNYKIVVCTAAGRRRYMQYLVPQILCSDLVDRYDIWVNTRNILDIEFFKLLAARYPKVNLVEQPDGMIDGIRSINAFYRRCIDVDTIYVKVDDDVIWLEPSLLEKMVKFRFEHSEYFLVSPLVINNALSTYLLQVHGKLRLNEYYGADCSHPVLWESGKFAVELHQWFIEHYLLHGNFNELHIGKHAWGLCRFSINCILWFGKDMKDFDGIVPGDDEEFLSCIYPSIHGYSNCINGDAIVVHYAFGPQRVQLEKVGILEKYAAVFLQIWEETPVLESISRNVSELVMQVDSMQSDMSTSYCSNALSKNELFKRLLPKKVRRIARILLQKEPVRYILQDKGYV